MKKVLYLISLSVVLTMFTGCSKNNEGSLLFWWNYMNHSTPLNSGANAVDIFVNGLYLGTTDVTSFTSEPMECGDRGALEYIHDLGKDEKEIISVEYYDEDGILIRNDNYTIEVDKCTVIEL